MVFSSLSRSFLPLICLALLITTARGGDGQAMPLGATLFQNVCASCHGPNGQGSEPLKIPSIAGRPAWYVLRQLDNFTEGRRGTLPSEPQAMIMAAMVKSLTPAYREGVAAFIESLPLQTPAPVVLTDADMAAGKLLFEERCMECHRYNASGEMTFGSPPLLGLQGWYVEAQIQKFKDGRRGAVPGDAFGAKMVFSSQFIESGEALHNVVAYIISLNPAPIPVGNVDALFKPAAAKALSAEAASH